MLSKICDKSLSFPDMEVRGITSDSRAVRKGFVFAALTGSKVNGEHYVKDAIHNGAVCILANNNAQFDEGAIDVPVLRDENPRALLAKMAARFYDAQPDTIVAVTGTNGKTSVVNFVQQLWTLRGVQNAVSYGTLGVRGGVVRSGSMTTPDPVSLHAEMADLTAAGITHLAMEASSHGLDQHRLDGVKVGAAAFTNLTQDHLDYHGDMESYFESKARLFTSLLPKGARAVLNADDARFVELKAKCVDAGLIVVSYGEAGEDILLKSHTPTPKGQDIEIIFNGEEYVLTLPLVGHFQVMNALCALGLSGVDPKLLARLSGVPGRMQLVSGGDYGAVYVDYAHTPDALRKVLMALRPHTQGRLICIAGCGGDRDARKRPLMGQMAAEGADIVIATDDNPRSEDPDSIRQHFMKGAPDAIEVGDRAQAIQKGISLLQDGDVLVIAGKGHESGQEIAGVVYPFNDYDIASKILSQKGNA